ncbi:LamG domain-containing protein [Aeoliella sp. ICT_H6.2]|uniref:LamG domain-containing protein n=1 Tax=Aeoliella straminimaris TaxID=2954799 RepID=A0A9X2JJT0_9BACT|nr:LamG domain-containing protein [Aeoliella straminimaris]MCO6047128.1 LamG domain-containing protein [Aeoliella straminimaris]
MKAITWQDASRVLYPFALLGLMLPCLDADAAYTLDRWYRMGDDSAESASNNGAVTFTYDSSGQLGQSPSQLADLTAVGSPLYVNISADRPHANATLDDYAISFDGTTQYLHGPNLNIPAEAARPNNDYTGITDRGYQLWAKPTAADNGTEQSILDDGDVHQVLINSGGNFGFEIRTSVQIGNTQAVSDQWVHLAQVRPNGDGGGAFGWVNGRAVATQTGDYPSSDLSLAIGANVERDNLVDPPSVYTPRFIGLVSDVEMFVLGGGFGTFDYTTDNGYFTDVFLPEQAGYSFSDTDGDQHNDIEWVKGDINFDGTLDAGDIDTFIAGWLSPNPGTTVGGGPALGDYVTLGLGDLDLDGDTDVDDWFQLRATGISAGVAAFSQPINLPVAVPEPDAALLLAISAVGLALATRYSRG